MSPPNIQTTPSKGSAPAQFAPTSSGGERQATPGGSQKQRTVESFDTEYRGPIIPPGGSCRTLVLCFDGTGDQFDDDNSNIVHLFSMLKKGDTSRQMVYYQAGIGTYTIPQIATPMYAKLSKTIDMMLAHNLNHHTMGGYEFLMENYREGDKICIFGFSRGAFTARALAGMVHKVGLLPASNHQQVPFAYKMYMSDDEKGWNQSVLFKKTFSMDVPIQFVGVWDTVSSVGIVPKRLPFTRSNTSIKTFRHAISLDEHRAKFKPNFYHRACEKDAKIEEKKYAHERKKGLRALGQALSDKEKQELEMRYTDRTKPTDVLEVWFAGCHCDVGGGSVKNDTRHSLARIPLRWMIRQCFLTNTGIQFEADKLRDIGLRPCALYPHVKPRPPARPTHEQMSTMSTAGTLIGTIGRSVSEPKSDSASTSDSDCAENLLTEEEEDMNDALSQIYDQLEIKS
ncbi:hypothetical protein BD410DRAFT_520489 [Rickenella mellea]|uniref:T6SS Phospholipase effector Tle1-like catalytic domain-containing protein n=1 Tax=Rickenella mellea TaxID=50990 RepID=A0A4Y7QGG7_9AGAM|nr:hypothetical protein BD410DRAFT_520489 [Rickenella mellea]